MNWGPCGTPEWKLLVGRNLEVERTAQIKAKQPEWVGHRQVGLQGHLAGAWGERREERDKATRSATGGS